MTDAAGRPAGIAESTILHGRKYTPQRKPVNCLLYERSTAQIADLPQEVGLAIQAGLLHLAAGTCDYSLEVHHCAVYSSCELQHSKRLYVIGGAL
jgi:hypothetical protein